MRYLSAEEIEALHIYLMRVRWQEQHYGVRDRGLLESAANRPVDAAHYEGADLVDQAARLWESLCSSHPFHQGNKRTAYTAAEAFLRLNGFRCVASDADIIERCMRLAQGAIGLSELASWLRENVDQCDETTTAGS